MDDTGKIYDAVIIYKGFSQELWHCFVLTITL